jgi:hypothetical protein
MSVHQESIEIKKPVERIEEAPELEYRAVSHDSLSMFLAAIGGAILGMLLTLLILALINGGTLSFSGGERLRVFEATLERVNENVGAVSANVDIVSQQTKALASQLGAAEQALRAEMTAQEGEIVGLGEAVSALDRTRQQFDLFMGALNEAMTAMAQVNNAASTAETPAVSGAPVANQAPSAEVTLPPLSAVNSADVAAGALSVLLFVDSNANGALDEGESPVAGAAVALLDATGKALASEKSSDTGVLFSDLTAGDYEISVEDSAGYQLLSEAKATVTVAEGASEGQIIYVPVAAE